MKATFAVALLLSATASAKYFQHHSWETFSGGPELIETFQQQSMVEMSVKDLSKKLRSTVKSALKHEGSGNEADHIYAVDEAQEVRNIQHVLAQKINETVTSGQGLDEITEPVQSLAAIKEAISEIEGRLHMEKEEASSAKMLQTSIEKLEEAVEKEKKAAPAPPAQPTEEVKPASLTAPASNSTIQAAVQVSKPTEEKKTYDELAVAKAVQATLAKNAQQLAEAKALAEEKESERLHQEEVQKDREFQEELKEMNRHHAKVIKENNREVNSVEREHDRVEQRDRVLSAKIKQEDKLLKQQLEVTDKVAKLNSLQNEEKTAADLAKSIKHQKRKEKKQRRKEKKKEHKHHHHQSKEDRENKKLDKKLRKLTKRQEKEAAHMEALENEVKAAHHHHDDHLAQKHSHHKKTHHHHHHKKDAENVETNAHIQMYADETDMSSVNNDQMADSADKYDSADRF